MDLTGWGRWHAALVFGAALPLGLAALLSGLHWAVGLVLFVVVLMCFLLTFLWNMQTRCLN